MNNHIPNDVQESNRLKGLLTELSTESTDSLLEDLMVLGDRPEVLSLLVYKLAEERNKTNQMIQEINKKYDKIMDLLYVSQSSPPNTSNPEFLPEQDIAIVDFIKNHGKACAEEIRDALKYKGLNAASQRLNKLHKDGMLEKKRVGQKVVFVMR